MSDFSYYRVHNDHQEKELGAGNESINTGKFTENMLKNMTVNIMSLDPETIVFEMIGIDTSIANALRRIMLAEVPTVAIEHVYISKNTSIIQDEVLAHRIGLIPINCDPDKLEDLLNPDEETDKDTVVFNLNSTCTDEKIVNKYGKEEFVNQNVLSSAFQWVPAGNQLDVFPEHIAPVHSDIVVASLRPGQGIELEAHCRKGIGKDHTKFSPVATASYRLLPRK